ncbi:uncharacterized protein LOC119350870 [Triticum dicoccoides]|uniref:uncharacterized protein LOC119350870 n=1 Tax=Triticum dicoccoides TaxID=85692 RepID=UPI00188F3823|nr:uncharacterized protein LOC119350870 [Triticum dicoccoides]
MAVAWIEADVKWLSFYVYRIVVLLSLTMYIILATFSESRRREGKGWKRGLLWLAYQLTDWCPAYVISNLYLETLPCEKMIVAFWVPFLLLHNARPDNISAFISEDSELWLRVGVFVFLQSVGSAFIVYRYILHESTAGLLRQASFIMVLLGLCKYVESAAALRRCNLNRIRRSFKKLQPNANSFRDDYGGGKNLEGLKDEEALLFAHSLFDICKGAFSDYSVEYMNRDAVRSMFSGQWESMCKVVEMELSLMHDILYTKTSMVHTWHGYAVRVVSPPLTTAALVLFFIQCKECMNLKPIDKAVSYILLGTTLLHDVISLFRTLASGWTHSYFKRMSCNWFKHQFWCRGRWAKLRRFVVSLRLSRLSLWLWTCACPREPKSYRRWAGTFGQCNMFDQCTVGNRRNLYSIPGLTTESKGQLSSRGYEWEDHSRGLEIPDNVKKLVFINMCKHLFPGPELPHEQFVRVIVPPSQCNRPDKQAVAEYSPRSYEQQTVHCSYSEARPEQHKLVNILENFYTDLPDTNEEAADMKHTDQSDEDMRFHLELQEVILIWHIATDVFLARRPSIEGGKSEELVKAIKQMSDYMMFLVAKRPQMLPGRTLGGLHEKTRRAVELIWKVAIPTSHATKEKEVVAKWMLNNMDDLNDPNSAIWGGTQKMDKDNLNDPGMNMTSVWRGAQLAQMLLNPPSKRGESKGTVQVLAYWIPDLQQPHRDMEGMLEFILDAWVRLLMFASIRCSRDSHAKQLSCGGELATLVWIIMEHTKSSVVKKHLKSLLR